MYVITQKENIYNHTINVQWIFRYKNIPDPSMLHFLFIITLVQYDHSK